MTQSQKRILAILSFVAFVLVGTAGFFAFRSYRAFVTQPLGPSLPIVAQTMPPTQTLWDVLALANTARSMAKTPRLPLDIRLAKRRA
ncbi:MAG TPA: hypothetical protein PLN43_13830, partial [Anaerolineales bacterium]|nr:hypothetical protein [Anaerolineales bacterium]